MLGDSVQLVFFERNVTFYREPDFFEALFIWYPDKADALGT